MILGMQFGDISCIISAEVFDLAASFAANSVKECLDTTKTETPYNLDRFQARHIFRAFAPDTSFEDFIDSFHLHKTTVALIKIDGEESGVVGLCR